MSKESIICRYWYFLDKDFKFQPDVYNGCHDVSMMFMNLKNIAVLNNLGANNRCIMYGISKSEAVYLLQNADLSKKIGSL